MLDQSLPLIDLLLSWYEKFPLCSSILLPLEVNKVQIEKYVKRNRNHDVTVAKFCFHKFCRVLIVVLASKLYYF